MELTVEKIREISVAAHNDYDDLSPDVCYGPDTVADLCDFALTLHTELRTLYGPIRAARRHLDGTATIFAQRDPGAVLRQLQRAEAQLERLFPDLAQAGAVDSKEE